MKPEISKAGFPPLSEEAQKRMADYRKKQLDWVRKIDELKKEITALDELQQNPIIKASALSIAVFLLKSQIIEFELKQAIFTLDREVASVLNDKKSDVRRLVRSPKEMNELTLGKTIGLFCEFDGIIPDELKADLKRLNKLRNEFTHNLFEQGKEIESMKQDACSGIKLANQILGYIEKMTEILNQRRLEALRKMFKKDDK